MTMSLEEYHETVPVGTLFDGNLTVVNPWLAASITDMRFQERMTSKSHGSELSGWDSNLTGLGVLHRGAQASGIQTTTEVEILRLNNKINNFNQQWLGSKTHAGALRYILASADHPDVKNGHYKRRESEWANSMGIKK